MGRRILAVAAGILSAFALVAIIEAIGHMVYPPPPDLDMTDSAAMAAYMKTLPIGAFLFFLAAWVIATIGGGLLACFIAKEKPMVFAGIVGGLILLGTIAILIMIPHPVWLSITGVLGIILATFLAAKVAGCKFGNVAAS